MLIKVYVRDLLWLVIGSVQEKKRSSESEDLESLMKYFRREVNHTKDKEMAHNKHSDSLAQPTPGKIQTKKRSLNARLKLRHPLDLCIPTSHQQFAKN
ncbi:hypothetical protein LAZ67_1001744 [Cordylochernes scorpioides]|uniref:Uncharacterized protein n=1 Tax=Cordylochernes scorpioides TaxID=51811 RepID=A0ABY6JVM7_9ARAC|nr:hypothetical protein LAZ67_1001744 [Cordylochernes scorpioides]